jgi:two-component system phosphate regulon sensor histidine kinase PhoR
MPKKTVGILSEYLVDAFDEACVGIDKEGRIHFLNRTAAALFNVEPARVIGAKIWDALEMSDFTRAFARMVKSNETDVREHLVVMPDQRALQAQFYPVRGTEGRLTGAVAVLRDVSTIKRIEKDVSTLVHRIAEELKVPLTSIKGYVETLLEGAYTEPVILRKFLQIINDETNRMARLLVGLMDAGETRRNPADAPMGAVSILACVQEVASSLSTLVNQKSLVLELDIPDTLPPVHGNDALLRQAVTNLMDNAIKIAGLNRQIPEKSSEPGFVRVVARADMAALSRGERQTVGFVDNGAGSQDTPLTTKPTIRIEVHDNGVGIPRHDQPKIFERFYRVTEGPSAQLGGTGLGLSIVREIVEGCGGTIEVRSTPGVGSTFVVTLLREGS